MSSNYLLTDGAGYLLQNQPSEIQEVSSYQEDDEQSQIQNTILKGSNIMDKIHNSTNNEIRSQQTMNSNYNNNANHSSTQNLVSGTHNFLSMRQNSYPNMLSAANINMSDTSMKGTNVGMEPINDDHEEEDQQDSLLKSKNNNENKLNYDSQQEDDELVEDEENQSSFSDSQKGIPDQVPNINIINNGNQMVFQQNRNESFQNNNQSQEQIDIQNKEDESHQMSFDTQDNNQSNTSYRIIEPNKSIINQSMRSEKQQQSIKEANKDNIHHKNKDELIKTSVDSKQKQQILKVSTQLQSPIIKVHVSEEAGVVETSRITKGQDILQNNDKFQINSNELKELQKQLLNSKPNDENQERRLNQQDQSISRNMEEQNDDERLSTEANVERQLQNEITIFDTHPDIWIDPFQLQLRVFGLNERKRRRMRRLGIQENDQTQPLQDEDLYQDDQEQLEQNQESPKELSTNIYKQQIEEDQDEDQSLKFEEEQDQNNVSLKNQNSQKQTQENNQQNLVQQNSVQNNSPVLQQKEKKDKDQVTKRSITKTQQETDIKKKIQEADQLRNNLQSREGTRQSAKQSSPSQSQIRQNQKVRNQTQQNEFDQDASNYSPEINQNYQNSNNSPQTSSIIRQSTLKQSSVGSLPNSMQWSNQMERQKQRAENRINTLDRNQNAQTFRNVPSQLQQRQQNNLRNQGQFASMQPINNLNHLQNHPKTSQPSSRIRIGGGIQQRKQTILQSLVSQTSLRSNENQNKQEPNQTYFNNDISNLRASVDDISQSQLPFIQSPYAAHLNFKTFENFFDVEICGEEEKGGKTIYKLKKINQQKKSYQQQMLMWMLQNQQQNPQLLMNGEILLNQQEQNGNSMKIDSKTESREDINQNDQEMILAEGFQRGQNSNQRTQRMFKQTNGLMRNHSQPILNNNVMNSRASRTADNNFRRNIRNVYDMNGINLSQGNFPQNVQFQNGRQLVSGNSERLLHSKQDAFTKQGKYYQTNPGQSNMTNQMSQYQSQGSLHKNFRMNQHYLIKSAASPNTIFNQTDKVDENQQYNYTIDLAQLNQNQIRNVATAQQKQRGTSQGLLPKDNGVNHNFINNNINININHNFTPTSNSEQAKQIGASVQATSQQVDSNKIIINTASINPIKTQINSTQQNSSGLATAKSNNSGVSYNNLQHQKNGTYSQRFRMTSQSSSNIGTNGESINFPKQSIAQRTNQNTFNKNFIGGSQYDQSQFSNISNFQQQNIKYRPGTQGVNTNFNGTSQNNGFMKQRSLK
eukprot:403333646